MRLSCWLYGGTTTLHDSAALVLIRLGLGHDNAALVAVWFGHDGAALVASRLGVVDSGSHC